MIRTTPFHPRLAELSQTGLWGHWAGYLSAVRYDFSAKFPSSRAKIDNVIRILNHFPVMFDNDNGISQIL